MVRLFDLVNGRTDVRVSVEESRGVGRSRHDLPCRSTDRDLRPCCNTLELRPRVVLIAGNTGWISGSRRRNDAIHRSPTDDCFGLPAVLCCWFAGTKRLRVNCNQKYLHLEKVSRF